MAPSDDLPVSLFPSRAAGSGWGAPWMPLATSTNFRKKSSRALSRGRRPGRAVPPPPAGQPLYIDIDATLVMDHSDNKQDAAPTVDAPNPGPHHQCLGGKMTDHHFQAAEQILADPNADTADVEATPDGSASGLL